MATSRTGTSVHKRMVKVAITEAIAQGLTLCPNCNNPLDYDDRTSRHGAQADEIVAYAKTGHTSTDPTHWQVLCALCNQRKSDGYRGSTSSDVAPFPHSRWW